MKDSEYIKLQDYADYQSILKYSGEFKGFRELISLEKLESKLQSCDYLCEAKAIIIDFEISENISLTMISDIVNKINDTIKNNSKLIFGSNINKELKDNEVVVRLLASGI